jgi:hypothetical protein
MIIPLAISYEPATFMPTRFPAGRARSSPQDREPSLPADGQPLNTFFAAECRHIGRRA